MPGLFRVSAAAAAGEAREAGDQHFHHQFVGPLLGAAQVEVGLGQQPDRPGDAAATELAVLVERLLGREARA